MEKKIKILHLEDSSSDAELVKRVLKKGQIDFERILVETKEGFLEALVNFVPDIILSDHSLPSFNSHEALNILRSTGNKTPFILITANVSEEFAVDVIGKGADDYILKDRLERLPTAIQNVIEKSNLEAERQAFLSELIKNEKRYHTLIENGADAVVILNKVGVASYISSSIKKVLGYNEVEAMELNLFELTHPDDRENVGERMKECMVQPGIPINGTISRIKHKNGEWVWLEGTLTNMFHDPDINGIVNNFRDVTERKLAEEKIKNANRLYAFIGQINHAIVHVTDDQTLFNEACRIAVEHGKFKMTWIGIADTNNHKTRLIASHGATKEEKYLFTDYNYDIGGPIEKVLNGLNYCVIADIQEELQSAGTNSGFNSAIVLAIKKSGKTIGTFNIYSKDTNFFDQEEIELLIKATEDISFALDVFEKDKLRTEAEKALKQSESKLKESELFNKGILASLSSHIAVIDKVGHITSVNKAWHDFARENQGLTFERSPQGSNYFDMCKNALSKGDSVAGEVLKGILSIFNKEVPVFELEYSCHSPEKKRWFLLQVLNFGSDDSRVVLSYQDITERKLSDIRLIELHTDLQSYTKELVISNTELEQFSYIISHNLRAPVANIMGLTEELKDASHSFEVKEVLNEALSSSIKILNEVTIDLNTILKVKREISEIKENVNLSELIASIQLDLQNKTESENFKIIVDFEEVSELLTHKKFLYSIFSNLISNSVKYCQRELPTVIEIKSETWENHILISFKDNGIGIDINKKQDQVFGLYKRFHHHIEGKGMGLFMVKKQVETLGGKITVESEINKGTEFKISLPLHTA